MSTIDNLFLAASIFYATLIGLQFILSKNKKAWPGLILPILNFILSVILVLIYSNKLGIIGASNDYIITILSVILVYNISTILLLVIYRLERKKLSKIRNKK